MHRLPTFGMRIVKSSLSVMLCLLLAHVLRQPPPIFACMAAIVVTRENVHLSIVQGAARVLSTIVGCLFAILIMFINIENMLLHILFVGLGCALTIYFCLLIKHPEAAALSALIFLSLILTHPADKYMYSIQRMIETIVGIAIALGVNALLRNKKSKGDADAPQESGPDS